ncbi:MAG: asparagine synthase (glutamine-hydrolyzing) [Candidatus Hydrogenedentes bacterium]|nr:asparagine synthase (glutamine-hydrolyzing) [Candidatus Hydrogenedentota bacterium]
MCGICGIAHTDRAQHVDRQRLHAMNKALQHRGPDDSGYWFGGHVALAMRRLSVIDLFRGKQPFTNEEESIVLVYNGEIYNYRELRHDLEQRGHVFRTLSDTEVVLRAYEEHGDDALLRFNGMFAFALYDARHDRLLLARDRVGIKPLYYAFNEGTLTFASELDAVMRSGHVRGALNPSAIESYFTFLYVPAPDTIYRDVQKLMPGHKLVLQRGSIHTDCYWQLEMNPDPKWTIPAAAERYTELLADAVKAQCVSEVPLGAFLSGGIDSSSVVAMMHVNSAAPVKTFTIGFDDAHANELHYARIAAEHFETDHTEEILKPDMVDTTPYLARFFGEPFADSSALPMWLVSQVARREVTVALSGDGGDELFAGYSWLHMTRKAQRYQHVPAFLRRLADSSLRALPRTPFLQKVRRFSSDSFMDAMNIFRRRQTALDRDTRNALYGPELAACIAEIGVDRYAERMDALCGLSSSNRMLAQDFLVYLPDDILAKVDRMSMAHSLEARVPLLDNTIIDFAATLPFGMKLKGNVSKFIVKKAIGKIMPPQLMKQRKQGFAVPIHRWFRHDLRDHFLAAVLSHEARNSALLNRRAIRAMYDAHMQQEDNYGHQLWAVLMFEHWLRYAESLPGVSLSM